MKDKTTKEDHPLRDKGMPPMLFRDNHGELNVTEAGPMKLPPLALRQVMKSVNSEDIVLATDDDEFYYEGSNELVPEGHPVGLDVDEGDAVDLVLFSNIYWHPNVDTNED